MKALVFDNYAEKFDILNRYLNIDIINFEIVKFKNGEGKIILKDSVKDEDIIIFSDFSFSTSYMYLNKKRYYSKDEYYVELKRLISALDKPKSISVFLPLIYQCRQNSNNERESKDYLLFINELKNMGVDNIVTFEAHGEDSLVNSYSLASLFKDKNYDVVVSPDEGGVKRSKEYSKILKCDDTYFSKRRDLNVVIDGSNPISEYVVTKYDFTNKDVLIVDDILDSGSTLIKAIENIKNAKKIDIFVAYPLFSKGVKIFKKLVKSNKLNKIYVSDLIHLDKKIINCDYIEVVECGKLICEVLKEVEE